MEETALARYAIVDDDPLSASVEVDVRCELSRGDVADARRRPTRA